MRIALAFFVIAGAREAPVSGHPKEAHSRESKASALTPSERRSRPPRNVSTRSHRWSRAATHA